MKPLCKTVALPCFLLIALSPAAQPAPGIYSWESTGTGVMASSSTTAPATWVMSNGFTAITEGNGTGGSIRVIIGASLLTQVLRFDRTGTTPVIDRAVLKSTSGIEFKLNEFKFWQITPSASGTLTVTARRNGATVGTAQAAYAAATPLVKITVNVSSNTSFSNIDELVFTGFGLGFVLDDIITAAAITLPVHLLSYEARSTAQGVELAWRTADELNNSHFEINRSSDGANFTALATVPASTVQQNETAYSYIDAVPLPGNNYYQLIQYDLDGHKEHLGIRLARASQFGQPFVVSTSADIKINMNRVLNTPLTYELVSLSGIIMQKGTITNTVQQIPGSRLSKGIYLIRLSTGEVIRFRKE
jgi:hypothetical protein